MDVWSMLVISFEILCGFVLHVLGVQVTHNIFVILHRPSRTAYNTLLDAYAKSKEVQGAESIFKKMGQDK